MSYPQFDRGRLKVRPLAERVHDLDLTCMMPLDAPVTFRHDAITRLAARLNEAKEQGAARIVMMGAHVIRAGVSRYLIDWMRQGLITHVAMNGAGPIHDWELARIGATTESVARYIRSGEFGLWAETGAMNDVVNEAATDGIGMGEALGRAIIAGESPHRDISVLAAGVRSGVPVTVHVGIGQDILHEHPNCDGAATGKASYTDFLIFTQAVSNLEHGVLLSFGSAVMAPEVFLKALAMARNVAFQEGRAIQRFTTGVFDLLAIDDDTRIEAPKSDPRYYYRPWKTILARTVADGGESYYVQGDHRMTIPALHAACLSASV